MLPLSAQSQCPTLQPHGLYSVMLLVHGIFQARRLECNFLSGFAIPCHFLLLDHPTQGPNPETLVISYIGRLDSSPLCQLGKFALKSIVPKRPLSRILHSSEPCGRNLPNNVYIFTFYRNHSNTLYIILLIQ